MIVLGRGGDAGKLGILGGDEGETFAGTAEDAALVDDAAAIAVEVIMPERVRFGENAVPAELLFEKPAIAVGQAIRGAELDEEAVALVAEFVADPEVLEDLGAGFVEPVKDIAEETDGILLSRLTLPPVSIQR